MKTLKKFIRLEWGIDYKTIDKDAPLISLAEQIACESENCSVEDAYQMYIGHKMLHLPGLIAMMIVDEMGVDAAKVNATMTLRELFDL